MSGCAVLPLKDRFGRDGGKLVGSPKRIINHASVLLCLYHATLLKAA